MTPVETVAPAADFWSQLFVFVLATFIGLGVIRRVSRLLHTPLMSITNAISAIAVVGSIIVTGADYPRGIRLLTWVTNLPLATAPACEAPGRKVPRGRRLRLSSRLDP